MNNSQQIPCTDTPFPRDLPSLDSSLVPFCDWLCQINSWETILQIGMVAPISQEIFDQALSYTTQSVYFKPAFKTYSERFESEPTVSQLQDPVRFPIPINLFSDYVKGVKPWPVKLQAAAAHCQGWRWVCGKSYKPSGVPQKYSEDHFEKLVSGFSYSFEGFSEERLMALLPNISSSFYQWFRKRPTQHQSIIAEQILQLPVNHKTGPLIAEAVKYIKFDHFPKKFLDDSPNILKYAFIPYPLFEIWYRVGRLIDCKERGELVISESKKNLYNFVFNLFKQVYEHEILQNPPEPLGHFLRDTSWYSAASAIANLNDDEEALKLVWGCSLALYPEASFSMIFPLWKGANEEDLLELSKLGSSLFKESDEFYETWHAFFHNDPRVKGEPFSEFREEAEQKFLNES